MGEFLLLANPDSTELYDIHKSIIKLKTNYCRPTKIVTGGWVVRGLNGKFALYAGAAVTSGNTLYGYPVEFYPPFDNRGYVIYFTSEFEGERPR